MKKANTLRSTRIVAFLLAFVMMMSVCIAAAPVAKAEAQEVIFWHNRGGKAGETLDAIIADFNENAGKEAGIHITAVYQSDTVSALKTLVQAKDVANFPDMIQIFAGDVEYMSTVKQVVPMDSLMAKDAGFDAKILDSLLTTYTYNGTL